MGKTLYIIGFFALPIILYFEQFFHLQWEFKRGVKATIFLLYVIIGIYFNLI